MITAKGFKLIYKYFISVFTIFVFALNSFASEASLSGIDVNRNDNGTYKIILRLDGASKIKKMAEESNKLTVMLNSTLPSDAMDIVYDNNSNLTNVIVQKKNKNNTMIIFEGNNIQNADIYTKELSSGSVKQLNDNGILNGIFFIADKKLLATSVLSVIFIFFMMLMARPKSKRYSSVKTNNSANKKQVRVNTLRNKNLVQSRNIPSINSGINGSFNSARMYMTQPNELVVNNTYEEEQIRKAG